MDRRRLTKIKRNKIVSDRKIETSESNKNNGNSKSESDTDVFSLYSPKVGFATQLKKYRNIKSKFIGASKITLLPKHTDKEEGIVDNVSVEETSVGEAYHVAGRVIEYDDSKRERIVKRNLFPDEEPNLREAVHNKLKLKNKKLRVKTKIDKTSASISRDFLNLPSRSKTASCQSDQLKKVSRNSSPSESRKLNFPSMKSSYRSKGRFSFQPKSASTPFSEVKNHCPYDFDFDCTIHSKRNESERILFQDQAGYIKELTSNKREFEYNPDDFWNCQEDVKLDRSFQLIDAF